MEIMNATYEQTSASSELKKRDLSSAGQEPVTLVPSSPQMPKMKSVRADLRLHYKRNLEIGFVVTLVLLIGFFQLARSWNLEVESAETVNIEIEVADIPQTEQLHRPPPPPKPSIPIPSEDESIPDDLTIETTDLDMSDIPPPPPPPDTDAESHFFVAYDEAPQIIGGYAALLRVLEYPKLAHKSGIEGKVIAQALVTETGITERVNVLQVKPEGMQFEQSAIAALKKMKWKPAKQRDRAVKTWITVPIVFKLTD